MTVLFPVIYFYLLTFCPEMLSAFLPVSFLLLGVMILFRKHEKILVHLLLMALVLHVGCAAYEESFYSSALEAEGIHTLCGKVVSPPGRRKNRGLGYRLAVNAVMDAEGNAYSSKGVVYIISSFSDVDLGDEVYLDGTMGDGYFLASSTGIFKKNSLGLLRKRLSYLLLRSFPKGEKGNLSALLLTGSTLDGTTIISDIARQYGLSYLFALSGMHLALLAMLLRPFLHRLGGKRWGEAVVILILLVFVYMNGWKPSLTRALLFLVLSKFLETEYSFCLSFLFLLLFFPSSVVDLGTSLSFVSLGGILFLSKRMNLSVKTMFPFLTKVTGASMVSFSALVFSVPILMHVYGSWVPGGVVLAFPSGILIFILFFAIIFRINIPKTDEIITRLYEILPMFSEKMVLFHETQGWQIYRWFCGIAVVLYLFGWFLEKKRKVREWVCKTHKETSDFLSLLVKS